MLRVAEPVEALHDRAGRRSHSQSPRRAEGKISQARRRLGAADSYRRSASCSHRHRTERGQSSSREGQIETIAQQAQESLDLEQGPIIRVVIYARESVAVRVLMIIHHLAVDGVSWRVLIEDLQTACQELKSGREVRLPAKTTSIKRWAERLSEYAASSEVIAEADYWRGVDAATTQKLPLENTAGANTVATVEKVAISLNEEETRKLLKEVSRAYRTRINEVLVAGMEMGLSKWMRGERVKIDLEGHGRQEIGEGVDVTRTVGWFTAIYPVVLELREEEIGERLKRVKEEMRRVPGGGIGYGLLKYSDQQERRAGEQEEGAEILFNYLGQVDQVMSEEGMFSLAPERSGETRSPRGERAYALEVNAIVAGGRLQVGWDYSREQVSRQ